MANKIENMKSIPIKTYDFKVDFHVGEDDVIETFLDPNENKNISVQKRPATAKTSTWGNPKPISSKQFATKKAKGPKLAIVGTANVDSETPVQANNPVASNIFHFKSHLPVKKLADNPKLALSMFKKKTLGAKSEQVFQAPPEPFNNTTGFNSFNQGTPGVYYENKNSIYSKPMMNGLNSGKKLTKQGAQAMKNKREENALKSSGASSGMFQKRLNNAPKRDEDDDDEEGEEGVEENAKQRPKSAITPGYMKSNKREKMLKPPKKPEFDLDEEENAEGENEDDIENEDNNVKKAKAQPQKEKAKKKMLVKEPEEEEEVPAGDEFNDENLYKEEEEEVGTQSRNPPRNRPKEEKAKPMKPLPKRKPKRIGDEDFEEGASVYDENEADFEGGVEPEEGEEGEENLDEENNENNEENIDEENNGEENNEEQEEQASQASSKRRFRSNYANMMSELQGGLLTADAEPTFGFQDAEEDFGDQSVPTKKGIKEVSNRLLGKETKEAKNKDILGAGAKGKFVPYEFMNSLDGDTVQQQREKVTKGVTDFLKTADEKRKRQMEMGNQRKSTNDNVRDTNEYSNRMEFLNTRVQAKIAAMRNIIGDSKATTTQQNKILQVEDINSDGSIDDYQDDFEDYMRK